MYDYKYEEMIQRTCSMCRFISSSSTSNLKNFSDTCYVTKQTRYYDRGEKIKGKSNRTWTCSTSDQSFLFSSSRILWRCLSWNISSSSAFDRRACFFGDYMSNNTIDNEISILKYIQYQSLLTSNRAILESLDCFFWIFINPTGNEVELWNSE